MLFTAALLLLIWSAKADVAPAPPAAGNGAPAAPAAPASTTSTPPPTNASTPAYWCESFNGIGLGGTGLEFLDAKAYPLCTTGKVQSPIALETPVVATSTPDAAMQLGAPKFQFSPTNYSLTRTAHGPRLEFCLHPGPCTQTTVINGTTLTLLQIHNHSPSEHILDGKRYDGEVHFVHQDPATKALWVFGVFLTATDRGFNPVFDLMLSNPAIRNVSVGTTIPGTGKVDPAGLLPPPRSQSLRTSLGGEKRPYVRYTGSLTSEPCTEGVNWQVFLDPIEISYKQFYEYIHGTAAVEKPAGAAFFPNNRQLQSLNGRRVVGEDY